MTRSFAGAVLLDLDDTLFLEEDFVRSGLQAIARSVAIRLGATEASIFDGLWYDFRRLGRTGMFDRLLAGHAVEGIAVSDLVAIYRQHTPTIALSDATAATLVRLRQRAPLAIVTDGLVETQQRKVAALGVEALVDAVVYTWALDAPKPDPRGFLEACHQLGVAPAEAVIVGDDPFHDIEAARRGGMGCVRILTGRAREIPTRHPPAAYREAGSLDGVEAAIEALFAPGRAQAP